MAMGRASLSAALVAAVCVGVALAAPTLTELVEKQGNDQPAQLAAKSGASLDPSDMEGQPETVVTGNGAQETIGDTTIVAESTQEYEGKPLFAKVFYLNLDRDTKRKDHIEGQLQKTAVDYERIPGVLADDLEGHNKFWDLVPKGCCPEGKCHCSDCERKYLKRSCACDFVHRIAYETVAKQPGDQDAFYLVVEDDINFEAGWKEKAFDLLHDVPSDWEMLRIGMWGDRHKDDVDPKHSKWRIANRRASQWPDFQGYFGAHAVVLTPRKAQALVGKMKKYHGDFADRFTVTDWKVADDEKTWFKSYVSNVDLITVWDGGGSSRYDDTINSKAAVADANPGADASKVEPLTLAGPDVVADKATTGVQPETTTDTSSRDLFNEYIATHGNEKQKAAQMVVAIAIPEARKEADNVAPEASKKGKAGKGKANKNSKIKLMQEASELQMHAAREYVAAFLLEQKEREAKNNNA